MSMRTLISRLLFKQKRLVGPEPEKFDVLDKLLAVYDGKLAAFGPEGLYSPSETAPPRTPFTSDLPPEQTSIMKMKASQRLRMLSHMLPMQWHMWRGGKLYEEPFQPSRDEVPEGWVQELEERALALGASAIRYVKVPRRVVFRELGIPHEYAIVFTIKMDKEQFKEAPSFEAMLEVVKGYKKLADISARLSRWIRKAGIAAYPGTALGGLTDYSHIAELAGLGAIGYHGLLITPEDGAMLRINSIYTNATNLPITTENPHSWVRDFCSRCHKCIRKCPPQAIFAQPQPREGGGMQCIEHSTCRNYFAAHFGCAVCIQVCPFSQAGYTKIKEHFKGAPDAPQFYLDDGDDGDNRENGTE